jgi:hypothetical protein
MKFIIFIIICIALIILFKSILKENDRNERRYKGNQKYDSSTKRYYDKSAHHHIDKNAHQAKISFLGTSSNQESGTWNKEFLMTLEWKLFENVCAEYLRIKL